MTSDDITAPLKPVNAKDIDSTAELLETFKWFRENLSTRSGRFGELYQRWNGHPASKMGSRGWSARPWNPEDDRMIDDLGGIDFGPMLGDIERFGNLRASTDEMRGTADSIRNRLTDAWSGPAAQAAVDKLDELGKASTRFRDTLNQFAAALDAARTTTKEAITELKTAIGGQIKPFTLPEGVDLRRQQVDRLDVAMAGGPPFGRPYTMEELTRPSTVDLNQDGIGQWWSNETINALDAMCDNYSTVIGSMRKLVGETTTAIADSWGALNEALKRIHATGDLDPFGKIAVAATPQAKPSPQIGVHSQSADRVGVTVDGKRYEMDFGRPEQPSAPPPPAAAVNPVMGGGPPPGGGGGGGSGGGGGGGSAGGGGGSGGGTSNVGAAAETPLPPGAMTGVQVPAANDTPEVRPAAAPPAGGAGAPPGGGAPMGGMPMGGMGGGGGGQGGDQERQSKWRTQGDLFDDAVEMAVPMVIGDEDPYGAFGPKGKQ